jgi:hypothetical protein
MNAYPDDEVFFHHKGKPKVGKVLAVGKHGCTVDHEGEQHKLKWEHISGHKKRAPQQYKILHHGDDGMIIENQSGMQHYVGIPSESRAEQLDLSTQKQPKKNSPNQP